MRRVPVATRAPLAIGGFLAVPLFFASLMAFSLALERPHLEHGVLMGTTSSVEAKIWAASLAPSLIVVAAGAAAMMWRHGLYVSCVVAIGMALAVTSQLDEWAVRHARRFPLGVDQIPRNDPSNHLDRGQWEGTAKETALSLAHWTIALALAAALITLTLELRRRRSRPMRPAPPPPPETAEGEAHASVG
ncbi:MAG: hypothetical protein ACJ747_01420 [Gaiellaceae bacterium]|jgi:hypothetical protein